MHPHITPPELKELLSTHLGNIPFFNFFLEKINYPTDTAGNIYSNIVDNLKAVLINALEAIKVQEPESPFLFAYKAALEELLPYGTEKYSLRSQTFLSLLDGEYEEINDSGSSIPVEIYIGNSTKIIEELKKLLHDFEKALRNSRIDASKTN